MSFSKYMAKVVKRLDWLDIGLIKWSVLFLTLFLVSVWPWMLAWDWYWYLIIGLALVVRPLKRAYLYYEKQ